GPPRADDERRRHGVLVRLDDDDAVSPVQATYALPLADRRARRRRTMEEEGIELGTHDAVARHAAEGGPVLRAVDADHDRLERLDRLGIGCGIEREFTPHAGGHPAGAQLDAWKARGIEH